MARLESTAIGGFYPTPSHLVPLIAEPLGASDDTSTVTVIDPCAGEGEAIIEIAKFIPTRTTIYTCELEDTRHKKLIENLRKSANYEHAPKALHGDAFMVEIPTNYGSLLYLNPPYDLDPVHGRLEQKFLDRYTPALVEGGILIFVVPFYALKASAELLATDFEKLSCFRFPDEDFEAYKQVVLYAQKVDTRPAPDPRVQAQVDKWASAGDRIPVLKEQLGIQYSVPTDGRYRPKLWTMREFDIAGLLKKARPWSLTSRTGGYLPVPHILPEVPVEDLMFRTFPVATAPRPAHIAAGIASGLFNGRRVVSKTPGMPDLLVKGVFDREYITVEERTNRDGEVTSLVQVQQPKLVTTVLDLSTQKYSTLGLRGKTDGASVDSMTIEDLLDHYGPSLMGVMAQQCPVMYDPKLHAESIKLADVNLKLYTAQGHAARAVTALLGGVEAKPEERRGKAAILLGEIGSGKTTVALTVGRTICNRMLVMCPPHLLDSWRDETRKVLPGAEYRVLSSITDVDDLVNCPPDRFLVAVVSRETAKLGHGWEAVRHSCPKCGGSLPTGDLAKLRKRCELQSHRAVDVLARAAQSLALKIAPIEPEDTWVSHVLPGRFLQSRLKHYESLYKENSDRPEWTGLSDEWIEALIPTALARAIETNEESALKLLGRLIGVDPKPERIARVVRMFKAQSSYYLENLARSLVLLLPEDSDIQNELKGAEVFKGSSWNSFNEALKAVKTYGYRSPFGEIKMTEEGLTVGDDLVGSFGIAKSLLASLVVTGAWKHGHKCGEPLFQATAEPRRYPLSRYIKNRYADFFDLLVLDEGHEYATDGSAQERSAHRLTALGIPTILMTGSIMNGYAESLFMNMWSLSEDFRKEFDRDERPQFVDRYGYRKRVISEKDRHTGEVVAFGKNTDRVERSERNIGDAPGILPLFLFRHLLQISVTLHKADLEIDLPPCRQIKCPIEADDVLLSSYKGLFNSLKAQIKKDQFQEGLAGKLFGALAELPSYLDRSTLDTGNQDSGKYEIRYPDAIGGALVATGQSFPAEKLSNKEQWMLDTLRSELAEGRNVMVFSWHVNLLPRLVRIISQELGEEIPVLIADKVATHKRQDWINRHVVNKGRRVLVTNPVAIQTGLNNLVHFATEIWMENPAANPILFRQAIGRVDRIGQTKETRIYFPVYTGTIQMQLHELLLRKVAVSVSTDGLDPESMLLAAGASDSGYLSGLSIGKQLWNMLNAN